MAAARSIQGAGTDKRSKSCTVIQLAYRPHRAARPSTIPCRSTTSVPTCQALRDVTKITWLRQHPEVIRYVVLDDEDDCLDELPLFQPSSRTGLTLEISKGIEEFLAGRSDNDMRASALTRIGQIFMRSFTETKAE
jgi:hypothetical protein